MSLVHSNHTMPCLPPTTAAVVYQKNKLILTLYKYSLTWPQGTLQLSCPLYPVVRTHHSPVAVIGLLFLVLPFSFSLPLPTIV